MGHRANAIPGRRGVALYGEGRLNLDQRLTLSAVLSRLV